MIKKEYIQTGLIVIAILILLYPFVCTSKTTEDIKPTNELYERLLKSQEEKTNMALRLNEEVINQWRRSDSIKLNQYKNNQVRYEKIPVIIRDYSLDELRRAYSEY